MVTYKRIINFYGFYILRAHTPTRGGETFNMLNAHQVASAHLHLYQFAMSLYQGHFSDAVAAPRGSQRSRLE
jgi:hypothetical protein